MVDRPQVQKWCIPRTSGFPLNSGHYWIRYHHVPPLTKTNPKKTTAGSWRLVYGPENVSPWLQHFAICGTTVCCEDGTLGEPRLTRGAHHRLVILTAKCPTAIACFSLGVPMVNRKHPGSSNGLAANDPNMVVIPPLLLVMASHPPIKLVKNVAYLVAAQLETKLTGPKGGLWG